MGITAAILGIGIIGNNYLASYRWILFACSCLITIIIWFLDTFYLYQEKLYRELYSFVIQTNDESKLNFSLDARYKTIKELTQDCLIPTSEIIQKFVPLMYLPNEVELKKARHGGKLSLKLFPEVLDLFCVIDDKKTAIAIYKYSEMGYYECVRGINREDN